jgi:hypothetical protein
MSTLSSNYDTLLDHAKQFGPDGNISDYVEALAQDNEIVADMPYVEANKMTSHQYTVEVGLPTVYWKLLGAGVLASNGQFAQIEDACAMLESWAIVEKELADLGGQPARYRMNKARQHLSSMGIELAQTMFYGAASSPEEFIGLAPRYSSTSAVNAENVISGGGSGADNSSIWLLGLGESKIHGIFAKGTKAGIDRVDHGEQIEQNFGGTTGAQAVVYKEQFKVKTGIAVADWRYGVRIPNIDISNLVAKTSAADLMELMIKAIYRIPGNGQGTRLKFYMNRTCQEFLDIQGRDAVIAGGGLNFDNVGGKRVMSFRGVPIGRCDALTEAEAAVA